MVDTAQARRAMVDSQVRPNDVTDLRIIAAMLEVPRERFLPAARQSTAYLDRDAPVGETGRALLKPMVLAKLVQAAEVAPGDRVLDIGCASGYSSAILGRLAASVTALEQDAALARMASDALAGSGNVKVASGALTAGWADAAPYDAILLQGAVEFLPGSLLAQLGEGGRLVAIIGRGPLGKATLYRMAGGHASASPLFDAAAPMLPGFVKPPAFVF